MRNRKYSSWEGAFTLTKAKRTENGFTLTKAKRTESGFTLIEILVVIAILGILATIGLASFKTAQMRSRDAQRKSDLRQLSSALEIYYNDYEKYPGSLNGRVLGCPSTTNTPCDWNNDSIFQDGETIYIRSMPEDPSSSLYYYYVVDADYQGYRLYAHLENTQDTSIYNGITINCSETKRCNFLIEKSNSE